MILAKIKFYAPQQGGRFTTPAPGYHPQLRIGSIYTSCSIYPVDKEVIIFDFNMEYSVVLRLLFDEYEHQLHNGDVLEFYEGSKKIGEGIAIQKY